MITLEDISYTYPHAPAPVLRNVSLAIHEGEFVLVAGHSGAGKSTLLRLLNGLVPHFYGGRIHGTVRVAGRDPQACQPRDMADLVGFVFQDPEAQFVVDLVEDEIVFGMENLALDRLVMRRRVEEVLDQLAIAHLRRRRISTLSGGERQRVAIAAVLAVQPRVLVLDEPTSQLDPHAAEEVLTALHKLNADLGLTVVLCEHRLERVLQYVDRIVWLEHGQAWIAQTREALARLPLVPPLVELGRRLGWQPLPVTIKEARRFVIGAVPAPAEPARPPASVRAPDRLAAEIVRVFHSYGPHPALTDVSLAAPAGRVLALMGRNGSGKTTVLRLLAGLLAVQRGRVTVWGREPGRMQPEELVGLVGYVPQNPRSMLFHDTLREELEFTLAARRRRGSDGAGAGQISATLERLGIAHLAERYPRALSGGEAQRAAVAAVLVGAPRLLLLDEPTRGLDYAAKQALTRQLRQLAAEGLAVVMASHDVELVAAAADDVALLGDGELVVHGLAPSVLGDSLIFSPQIAKLFPGRGWLTVDDVVGTP